MQTQAADAAAAFTRLIVAIGAATWRARLGEIRRNCTPTPAGRALAQHHRLELLIDRRLTNAASPPSPAESLIATLAADLAELAETLPPTGRTRLAARFAAAMAGPATLVALFHLARCARTQRDRGFTVHHAGLEDGAAFDLLLQRDGMEAEMACETVSAEQGRDVHRNAWATLVDRIDPDLQAWLAAHPGRYLLKMTLPRGLKRDSKEASLAELHARITGMLMARRRAEHDEAAVLRLEPLFLAGAQAGERGLLDGLRREFGHEAHLAVTSANGGVLALAARATREDEVAEAVQRRMAEIAPLRLSGTRPGILAMFIEDTDRLEWRILRDQLRLEGAARQFLTQEAARGVIAVTCASRLELFGTAPPDGAEGGELRYRNPGHPMARAAALAPAIVSMS
jgi:hypothetical protein